MNCKPGELAVVVHAGPHAICNLGRVVRVLRLCTSVANDLGPAWEYEGDCVLNTEYEGHPIGTRVPIIEDDCLRPIRPNDTSDPRLVAEDLRNRNKVVARRFDAAREKAQQLRDRFDSESA